MVASLRHRVGNFWSRSGDYLDVTGRLVRAALGLGVVVIAVLLGGGPAYAHNSFKSSSPADKAVLDKAPAAVTLTFLAKLSPQGTKVTLLDPAGQSAAAGVATFNGASVSIPLHATVSGVYRTSYQVASSDGHPITGTVTFTLTEKALPSPTPAAPAAPSAVATSDAAVPVPSLRNTASDAAGSSPWWPWALGAVALVGVATTLVVVRRRRAS
jgi:methionine-rich copper-binding protein CopC